MTPDPDIDPDPDPVHDPEPVPDAVVRLREILEESPAAAVAGVCVCLRELLCPPLPDELTLEPPSPILKPPLSKPADVYHSRSVLRTLKQFVSCMNVQLWYYSSYLGKYSSYQINLTSLWSLFDLFEVFV